MSGINNLAFASGIGTAGAIFIVFAVIGYIKEKRAANMPLLEPSHLILFGLALAMAGFVWQQVKAPGQSKSQVIQDTTSSPSIAPPKKMGNDKKSNPPA